MGEMMHPGDPRSPESRHEDTPGAEPDDAAAASGGASPAGAAVDSPVAAASGAAVEPQVAAAAGAAVVTEAGSADAASPPTVPAPPVPPAVAPPPERPPERRGWSRRRKIFAWVAGALAVLLVVVVTGAYLVYRHLNGNLHQVNVSGLLGHQPVDLHPQAENILVIGSDTRFGQGRGYGSSAQLNTDHSDTLLIVHIAANRQWADVMSIPRDSWVNIPACRMGNGHMASPQIFKINEAYTIGNLYGNKTNLGTACTIKTVEANTGIRINHFVNVNFSGFKDMVNAVGGVPECNTTRINDPKSGLHLSAGHHLLNGRQALGYVRARYTLGNGSDLERITRQQAFMSALVGRVKSKLLNPLAIYRFLDAATKSITIDSQLGGIHGLYDLATSLKNLPPGKVTFFTLPTYPRSYVVPSDTANLLWTQPQDSLIFQAFRNNKPVSKALLKNPHTPQLSPAKVAVKVLNGTTSIGLQDTVAGALQQEGFRVNHTGTASSQAVTQTVIRYRAGQEAEALLLAKRVHGAALVEEHGVQAGTGHLILVVGSDYGTTTTIGSSGPAPQPASSFAPRTASQNICT
jgi:LCP family protein required for cell wall assembly